VLVFIEDCWMMQRTVDKKAYLIFVYKCRILPNIQVRCFTFFFCQ